MDLHRITSRLAKHFYRTFDVHTPECNAAPVLWRAVRYLHGTREYGHMLETNMLIPVLATLYTLAKKIAKQLSLTLTLHYSLSPGLKKSNVTDPDYHKYDNAPVEVSLMSAVIIALKLAYGLDGHKRCVVTCKNPKRTALKL